MWKLSEIEILEAKTKKSNCCDLESNWGPWDQKAKTLPLRHPGDFDKIAVRARLINLKTPLMTTPPYVSLPEISLRQIGLSEVWIKESQSHSHKCSGVDFGFFVSPSLANDFKNC